MRKTFLSLLLLLVCSWAEAKVLVIADIDDTLKVTNVRSKIGAGSSFFDDTSRFVGLPEVFQALARSNSDVEFHYVSLAPQLLMEHRHEEFLKENNFPITGVHTNPGMKQDPELKQKVIRQLLSEKKPELVIYFGDNGQFDPLVYKQMDLEFPSIRSITYIHEVYSRLTFADLHSTEAGQIGFVTALEVTLDLVQKKILAPEELSPIEDIVYNGVLNDDGSETFGEMVFPWWQDCRDFKWRWTLANPDSEFLAVKNAVLTRCQQIPH